MYQMFNFPHPNSINMGVNDLQLFSDVRSSKNNSSFAIEDTFAKNIEYNQQNDDEDDRNAVYVDINFLKNSH